jgi:hypothetical protein
MNQTDSLFCFELHARVEAALFLPAALHCSQRRRAKGCRAAPTVLRSFGAAVACAMTQLAARLHHAELHIKKNLTSPPFQESVLQ